MEVESEAVPVRSRHDIAVAAPYRLDLTVNALRRLATNPVDVLTPEGEYVRALGGRRGPVIVRVKQSHHAALVVSIEGDSAEHASALATVKRMLGVDMDVSHFSDAAATLPWLSGLAERMRGVKPPRYASLWEAFVNAVVFQQVSLRAASAIAGRMIARLGSPLQSDGVTLYAFPSATSFLDASDQDMRDAGLSAGKLAALRSAAEALLAGDLDEGILEALPSPEAAALLCQLKGIGPWTATVILLRGLQRLDVFPMKDSSVTRNLALVGGQAPLDIEAGLAALSPQQGMLYYHLLLARLESRGELGGG